MPQMSKVELYAAIRRDHRGGMNMASRTNRRPNEFRVVELIHGTVTEAGLDGAEAAVHYRMVGDSPPSSSTSASAPPTCCSTRTSGPPVRAADESSWNREYRLVDSEGFPHFTHLSTQLVPHQATFALSTTARRRWSSAWRFRQMM
ncbi:hypothetical protein [Streptomyces sp. NPDC058613]|uniref:hypothetical protein n=1 Tax=Streptomyces sp. NPDC058613 TaxID=3346556 RepID=UPI00365966F6